MVLWGAAENNGVLNFGLQGFVAGAENGARVCVSILYPAAPLDTLGSSRRYYVCIDFLGIFVAQGHQVLDKHMLSLFLLLCMPPISFSWLIALAAQYQGLRARVPSCF